MAVAYSQVQLPVYFYKQKTSYPNWIRSVGSRVLLFFRYAKSCIAHGIIKEKEKKDNQIAWDIFFPLSSKKVGTDK